MLSLTRFEWSHTACFSAENADVKHTNGLHEKKPYRNNFTHFILSQHETLKREETRLNNRSNKQVNEHYYVTSFVLCCIDVLRYTPFYYVCCIYVWLINNITDIYSIIFYWKLYILWVFRFSKVSHKPYRHFELIHIIQNLSNFQQSRVRFIYFEKCCKTCL